MQHTHIKCDHTGGRQVSPFLQTMVIEGEYIPVEIKTNKRARRIIIKVDGFKKIVQITCPKKENYEEALFFAKKKQGWIAECLRTTPAVVPFLPGEKIPFHGIETDIVYCATGNKRTYFDSATRCIFVHGLHDHVNTKIKNWLKREAYKSFSDNVAAMSRKINVVHKKISIRDTKSRWGSCSAQGNLSFSWRLILAPEYVLTYVSAHEVAHLRYLNHSPAFWQLVDRLTSTRPDAEAWLRENGPALHAFGVAQE